MSPAQPWRQQLDEKPAAVEGQQWPQQMETCQLSERLKNHLVQEREVENGRWQECEAVGVHSRAAVKHFQ